MDLLRASALAIVPFGDGKGSVALAFRRSYYELLLPLITDDVVALLHRLSAAARLSLQRPAARLAVLLRLARPPRDRAVHRRGRDHRQRRRRACDYAFDQVILRADWQPDRGARAALVGHVRPDSSTSAARARARRASARDTRALRLGQRVELGLRAERALRPRSASKRASTSTTCAAAPELRRAARHPRTGLRPARRSRSAIGCRSWRWRRTSSRCGGRPLRADRRPARRVLPLRRRVGAGSRSARRGALLAADRASSSKPRAACSPQPPLPFQLTRGSGNPNLAPDRALAELGRHRDRRCPRRSRSTATLFYSHMWQLTRADGTRELDEQRRTPCGRSSTTTARVAPTASSCCCAGAPSRAVRLALVHAEPQRALPRGRRHGGVRVRPDARAQPGAQLRLRVAGRSARASRSRPAGRSATCSTRTATHVVYDADEDDYDADSAGRRMRLPTYHQLDVRIDREWKLGPDQGQRVPRRASTSTTRRTARATSTRTTSANAAACPGCRSCRRSA